jgi:hypothetical protein
MPDAAFLTERQEKWFASVRDGLERETGRSLSDWAELARACPESAPRKRLAWMKAAHGLGQNRAALVLNAAFPPSASWSNPGALADVLWSDPMAAAVEAALRRIAMALPDARLGQRKGFTAYSRNFQFAACRPWKRAVVLGLAIEPATHLGLEPAGKDGWSERLLSRIVLDDVDAVTDRVAALLRAAWERS